MIFYALGFFCGFCNYKMNVKLMSDYYKDVLN